MEQSIKRLIEMKKFIKDEKSLLLIDSLVEIQDKINNIPESLDNYIDVYYEFSKHFSFRLSQLISRLDETKELKC